MYRLGDDWVPLQKGDYCFMDAYIPQACYAIGDEGREEELVYIYSIVHSLKDVLTLKMIFST